MGGSVGGWGWGERFRFANKLNVQLNNKWIEFTMNRVKGVGVGGEGCSGCIYYDP